MARAEQFGMHFQQREIVVGGASLLKGFEYPRDPWQPFPAGGTPTARLAGKELFQIEHESDRTGMVVEHDHGSRSETTHVRRDRRIIHGEIEMFLDEKSRGGAAGEQPAKAEAVEHAAGMMLQQLARRRAKREFPASGMRDVAAHAVEFRAAVLTAA